MNDVSASANQRMRCLPYFYVMGMPKCGTTDLYAKIVRHDSVVNLLKEPHWWARKRVGRGMGLRSKRDLFMVVEAMVLVVVVMVVVAVTVMLVMAVVVMIVVVQEKKEMFAVLVLLVFCCW